MRPLKGLNPSPEKGEKNGDIGAELASDHDPTIINVKVYHGLNQYEVALPSNSSFGNLKSVMAEETGLKPELLKLLFRGKEKEDNEDLQTAGVKDNSKVLLMEDMAYQQKSPEEVKETSETSRGGAAVAEVRAEVDKLSEQASALQAVVDGGTKIDNKDIIYLTEMLMRQLLKLDGIEAEGEGRVQRKLEVRRVQGLVETMDILKSRNSNLISSTYNSESVTTRWETFEPNSGSSTVPSPPPSSVPSSVPSSSAPPAVLSSAPSTIPHSDPSMLPHSDPTPVPSSSPSPLPHPDPSFMPYSNPSSVPYCNPSMMRHSNPYSQLYPALYPESYSAPSPELSSDPSLVPSASYPFPYSTSPSAPYPAPSPPAPYPAPSPSAPYSAPYTVPNLAFFPVVPYPPSYPVPHSSPSHSVPYPPPYPVPHSSPSHAVPYPPPHHVPHSSPSQAVPYPPPHPVPRSSPSPVSSFTKVTQDWERFD